MTQSDDLGTIYYYTVHSAIGAIVLPRWMAVIFVS
jgi:hypothetical protein